MEVEIDILLSGVSGSHYRGWLGWSTIVLLCADNHRILFDTGAYNDRPGLLKSLSGRGVLPGEIDMVVLSHLHFDHSANLDLFPGATWYVHEDELAAPEALELSATPEVYRKWILGRSSLKVVSGAGMGLVNGVTLKHTPGHTPGSLSLFLETPKGLVAMAGDAVKTREELQEKEFSGVWDPEQARQSIRDISKARIIIPGHDVSLYNTGEPVESEEAEPWLLTDRPLRLGHPINEGEP